LAALGIRETTDLNSDRRMEMGIGRRKFVTDGGFAMLSSAATVMFFRNAERTQGASGQVGELSRVLSAFERANRRFEDVAADWVTPDPAEAPSLTVLLDSIKAEANAAIAVANSLLLTI
jgi:hypothetical protein